MRVGLVLCLLGCGATTPTPRPAPAVQEEVVPLPAAEVIEAWLQTVRVASVEVPLSAVTPPRSLRERVGDGVTTWTSDDGLWVIVRYDHSVYVVARAYAEPPPPGIRPRMIPVLHGGRWPHFAMLVDGWDVAVPLSTSGVHDWRVPLHAVDEGTIDETARLSHVTDWDVEDGGIGTMAYGTPTALAAMENRDIPSGFTLSQRRARDEDPNDPQWDEAFEAREHFDVDERLRIQTAPVGPDGDDGTLTRILLLHDDELRTAFRIYERAELDEFSFYAGVVMPVDDRLLVQFTVQGFEHYFSWHDAQTGERIGEPIVVGLSGPDFHGDPPGITPIVGAGELSGYVLGLGGALVVETLGAPGRYTPICADSPRAPSTQSDDDDYETPPYLSGTVFRLTTQRGVRCLKEERFD